MVEATTLMAAAKDVEGKRKLFGELKKEFPELPELLIWEKLEKYPTNLQLCIHELHEESNRYLYGGGGEVTDSPWPIFPPAPCPTTEALSISIPNSTVHYNPQFASQPPVVRPMTSAFPSSSVTTTVAAGTTGRQPLAEYQQALLQHQYQRLQRLKKELENEKLKLRKMRETVNAREQARVDIQFRVGGNPTFTDVKHLQDENKVLEQEISEMTNEIDQEGLELFDDQPVELQPGHAYATSPPTLGHPPTSGAASHPPPYTLRSTSCPSATPHNSRPKSLCDVFSMLSQQMPSPTTEEIPANEGFRDRSLENNDWVLVQQNHNTQEQTWKCRRCTFENHPALDTCEICMHRKDEPWRANIQ